MPPPRPKFPGLGPTLFVFSVISIVPYCMLWPRRVVNLQIMLDFVQIVDGLRYIHMASCDRVLTIAGRIVYAHRRGRTPFS